MSNELYRQLPSVDRLLKHLTAANLVRAYGHDMTVEALRDALEGVRKRIAQGADSVPSDAGVIGDAEALLKKWLVPTLRRVINATGVIVHTNLGRAPLSDDALKAIQSVGGGYSTLEFDLDEGGRGSRSTHAASLLTRLTGAEAAFIVNNNAAATLLALTALAGPSVQYPEGREVIVSRGELVEIGGGFRMPDVMAQSGARLIEVGTTNRTHFKDYVEAVSEDTGIIMRVHTSNYRVIGFTTKPEPAELIALAHEHNLLFVDDLGSGALYDMAQYGLPPEPIITESLAAETDVVLFSGDKLLGGPQAGILLGRAAVIDRLRRHPLARAVRPDKLCLAGLTATLTHYLKGEANSKIPVWRMISMDLAALGEKAAAWAEKLGDAGGDVSVVDSASVVGGGSLPGLTLPTRALAVRVDRADDAAARLRQFDPPVIVRREDDLLIIDPRTVLERDEEDLLSALQTLI